MTNDNGWGEYSKLVLKELETLAQGIKDLNESLNDMKKEMAEIRAKEDKILELNRWKERVDEVASPTQLKELKQEVEDLKMFRTKAVTVFAVIQFLMAAVVFAQRVL
jgi:regulator of replication initiation timing